MDASQAQQVVLSRFKYRCHIAGSVQAGYGMRAQAIRYGEAEHPGVDLGAGLAAMVEKGLLKQNAAGTWYYLTPEGAEQVKATA
ncbi:MAG TPA: hypothetical protein DD490_24325 [Acidobacteria bacterium]|nr:hypothetical protein [Acidobacteriota bacterium]